MKIASLQISSLAGDVAGNKAKLLTSCKDAADSGAHLAVAPELALTGYPSRDLLVRLEFVEAQLEALRRLAKDTPLPLIVGHVDFANTPNGIKFYNAASFVQDGSVVHTYHKRLLPTYDVFDEARYFSPGTKSSTFAFMQKKIGLSICEDAWNIDTADNKKIYPVCPIELSVKDSPDLLINLSASPYRTGKLSLREHVFSAQSKKHTTPMIVVNLVGAHDDLLFDGQSLCLSKDGNVAVRSLPFKEHISTVEFTDKNDFIVEESDQKDKPLNDDINLALDALVMGIADYAAKCGFSKAILGLSGGIDSALTAALASEALGPENILGVAMPSKHSSNHSVADARRLAENLKIGFELIPISESVDAMEATLAPSFKQTAAGVAEENIQARLRAVILMGLSNKFGHLLLATGNKSEMAVGYTTLYGDMCGGIAVLADVFKVDIYRLAEAFNKRKGFFAIPENTITKPPSAELRPDQKDQDSLPPYEILDPILKHHIEDRLSAKDIVARGFDETTVHAMLKLVERAEYKRFQSPPILRITNKSFGPGRRIPLAGKKIVF